MGALHFVSALLLTWWDARGGVALLDGARPLRRVALGWIVIVASFLVSWS